MKKLLSRLSAVVLTGTVALFAAGCASTPEHYPPTENGVLAFKSIPGGRQIRTSMPGDYFKQDNELFRRLFRYLESHELTMTVPVVSTVGEECSMAFYVLPSEKAKAEKNEENVVVADVPEQLAAVYGFRGNNDAESWSKGVEEMKKLLQAHPEYEIAGAFYATYWDSPMVPGFLRHYEITVPVRKRK